MTPVDPRPAAGLSSPGRRRRGRRRIGLRRRRALDQPASRPAPGRGGRRSPRVGELAAGDHGLGDPPPRRRARDRGLRGQAPACAQGERFPLFVSTTADEFQVERLPDRLVPGARRARGLVVADGPGRRRSARPRSRPAPTPSRPTGTRCSQVPTDDWPPGAYLLKLHAGSGGQRYVPVTVRSPSCAGKVVLKSCVQTWQAYNMWGGYDLYKDAAGSYGNRSLVVSLDRPYDLNGADMFLTYERNAIKLAESYLGPRPGLRDQHGHRRRPAPAGRGERAGLDGPRRVLDPGRARQRHRGQEQRRQPGLPRRERDVPPDPAAVEPARGGAPGGLLQVRLHQGPDVRRAQRAGHQRLARRARPRPGVLADRHGLRGVPGQRVLRGRPRPAAGCSRAPG